MYTNKQFIRIQSYLLVYTLNCIKFLLLYCFFCTLSTICTPHFSKTRIINDGNSPRTSSSRSAKYHPSCSNTSHGKPLTGETSRHVLWALRSGKATEERETGHFRETHVLPTNGTRHQIIRVGAAARELGTANCSRSWVNLSEKKFEGKKKRKRDARGQFRYYEF